MVTDGFRTLAKTLHITPPPVHKSILQCVLEGGASWHERPRGVARLLSRRARVTRAQSPSTGPENQHKNATCGAKRVLSATRAPRLGTTANATPRFPGWCPPHRKTRPSAAKVHRARETAKLNETCTKLVRNLSQKQAKLRNSSLSNE